MVLIDHTLQQRPQSLPPSQALEITSEIKKVKGNWLPPPPHPVTTEHQQE